MNANRRELICKNDVYDIVGCAMEVLNALGHGLREKTYENALIVEFQQRCIPHDQQRRFSVLYRGVKVDEYVPDSIAHNRVIVDLKVVDHISDHERGQVLNYLRVTQLPVGLILNFKHSRLEWERLALTRET